MAEAELFETTPPKRRGRPPKEKPAKAQALVKAADAPPRTKDEALDDLIILARAAADPAVDPAKMTALREIMKDIREERRQEAFTRDRISMQAELPEIDQDGLIKIKPKETARDQKVQKTPFATFNNIHRITTPILRKWNFTIWHEIDVGKDSVGILVRSFLKHTAGHQISSVIPLVLDTTGSKNNNQGAGSAASYGKRYNTIALLNIISKAPADADLNGHSQADIAEEQESKKTINGSQAKQLLKTIDECGVPITVFIDRYRITAAHELPANQFDEALKSCAAYKARVDKQQAKGQ
jgi:ERF superfamily